jgi:hypothetical protein
MARCRLKVLILNKIITQTCPYLGVVQIHDKGKENTSVLCRHSLRDTTLGSVLSVNPDRRAGLECQGQKGTGWPRVARMIRNRRADVKYKFIATK